MAQTGLPDLTIDAGRLAQSLEFQRTHLRSNDCAVIEGCVRGPGKRTLLRFDTATPNVGSADVVLGHPEDNPEVFEYSPCHGHYHFSGYATYELLRLDGSRVVSGRKQAFCLLDSAPYSTNAGPSHGYDCHFQGITAGWQDVYPSTLECQWLDVTGVSAGNYLLRVTINPEGQIAESDHSNNVVVVNVRIPGRIR